MWVIVGSLVLGSMDVVESPKEITREWETKVLGIQYEVTDLSHAVEEMVSGITEPYFGKEFLERVRKEIEKTPTGEYVEYWENGQLKAKIPYKGGRAHGHMHGWYEDGNDAFKGFFREGVKQGVHITFYPPGVKRYPSDARILIYDEQGRLDGKQTTAHPTGNLATYIEYSKGKVDGPLEYWDIQGKEMLNVNYKKGKLQKEPPPEPKDRIRRRPMAERYVNEVIREFKEVADKEFRIRACGSGAGMPFDVEGISVDFEVYKSITIEEARELMVKLTERFTEIINRHEKLRPYLREYPFTQRRADVSISTCQKDGRHYSDGSATFVCRGMGNKICYCSQNPKTEKLDDLLEESYDEAVKIVKGKK